MKEKLAVGSYQFKNVKPHDIEKIKACATSKEDCRLQTDYCQLFLDMIILLNKPFDVLCQFTDEQGRKTLADFIKQKNVYAAGRLDRDSEGLVVLTDDGKLQNKITDPKNKMPKTYWVQVEGEITDDTVTQLKKGLILKDGQTKPAKAKIISEPEKLWPRNPPIRERKDIPTSWLELTISEGRNRQVRRMTAATGFPTLRLIRYSIGEWNIENIANGDHIITTN